LSTLEFASISHWGLSLFPLPNLLKFTHLSVVWLVVIWLLHNHSTSYDLSTIMNLSIWSATSASNNSYVAMIVKVTSWDNKISLTMVIILTDNVLTEGKIVLINSYCFIFVRKPHILWLYQILNYISKYYTTLYGMANHLIPLTLIFPFQFFISHLFMFPFNFNPFVY
jgi:hypothetical protein